LQNFPLNLSLARISFLEEYMHNVQKLTRANVLTIISKGMHSKINVLCTRKFEQFLSRFACIYNRGLESRPPRWKRFPCQDEATGRTKIRSLNKRRGRTLLSYIETHRRRHYALLGLPETQNNRPRPTEFPGRKQRRHYNVPTPLYCEIGLLKNYAESRGPIPRNHSVEMLLSGQVLCHFVSPSPFDRHVTFETPQRVLCDISVRKKWIETIGLKYYCISYINTVSSFLRYFNSMFYSN